jgi:hypothetical protein
VFTVAKTLSTVGLTSAIRDGRAELLGTNVGDPVYLAGAFWQVSSESMSYELVVDPTQVAACAGALRRLRAARATPGAR